MGVVSLFLFVCGSALAVGVGAYLWSLHLISVGTVYLLFAYTDQLSQPIQQIKIQLQDLQQAEACIQRIETLLHTVPALSDGPGVLLPQDALAVQLENVSFGYVAGQPVLWISRLRYSRAKCWACLGERAAAKRRWLACYFAFTTRNPVASALAVCQSKRPTCGICGGASAW